MTDLRGKKTSEQLRMSEKPASREVFDQVKDDSTSLIVLCDTGSCSSRRTLSFMNSFKISMTFPFNA